MNDWLKWILFAILSVIWGSSFILMKAGMQQLTPYQVAALRILSAGLVLLPTAIKQFKKIPNNKMGIIIISGLLGSFFPAFLFCIAETRIDSSLAGILNALTPIFVLGTGIIFFENKLQWQKATGVIIGFIGLCLLFVSRGNISFHYLSYAGLVLIATLLYGLNVNIVGKYLKEVGSLNIAAFAFSFLTIPALLILFFSGFFLLPLSSKDVLISILFSITLGVMGTALATILFYMLLKKAGPLFSSMVTYGIPFVAITWGIFYGEQISLAQVGCLAIILWGVFITSK